MAFTNRDENLLRCNLMKIEFDDKVPCNAVEKD